MIKVLDTIEFRQCDVKGCGYFGAPRGDRKHKGLDLVAYKNDKVYAPFSGTITKHGYAYFGADFNYIEITGPKYRARIFYAELDNAHYVGKTVSEGQFIGVVEGIEDRYKGITPHIHIELYEPNSTNEDNPLDPTPFFKKKD